MRVLLTGGSGFIGRNLVQQLSNDYEVFAPTHGEIDLLDEDVTRSYFCCHSFDAVVHAAVTPGHRNAKDPTNLVYRNTRMLFNITRNAGRFGRLIFLSSGAVYDMRHYQPKMPEAYFDAHVPVDEFGYSKYVCARHVESLEDAVELRLFGVFGKYEDWSIRFISNAISKTLFDLPITINQNRRFDYVSVDDVTPVVKHFIENRPRQRAYNVTPDGGIELKSIAEKVRDISGKCVDIRIGQPGMGIEYSGDNWVLRQDLPDWHLTPIDDAISKLYSWYLKNTHAISKDALLVDK